MVWWDVWFFDFQYRVIWSFFPLIFLDSGVGVWEVEFDAEGADEAEDYDAEEGEKLLETLRAGIPANATKQATITATPTATPKPTSPAALPTIGLASKTPAVKTEISSLIDDLDKLLLNDDPTEEEIKAWSLENYGTYRKSDYISLVFCNVAPNERW